MFNELWQLIKWLFASSPKDTNELEIVEMKYFPIIGFAAMSWCGKLIIYIDNMIFLIFFVKTSIFFNENLI